MAQLKIGAFELHPFDLAAKDEMESYLARLDLETSDYTFAANYIWLSHVSGFYAIIEDTFCFFMLAGGDISMVLPPLGRKEDCYKAMQVCFDLMNSNNKSKYHSKIDYVDEQMLEGFVNLLEGNSDIFEMLEHYLVERQLVDYVYETDALIDLKGNDYQNKRNEINKFKRAHPNYRTEVLDIEKHSAGIQRLFHKWVADRMKFMPNEKADAFMDGIYFERLALEKIIKDYAALSLIGLVIYIDDEIKGFTVGERINATTASIIIEKTDFEVLGCAQFIFREFSKQLKETYQSQYINVGDDMGFENLKKVKMSYRPCKLIPKYTIYQK
ncbi:MAG: DUF2156 domain-containing protein [Hahellaceae bacterium]|jgi:hypothetical protein|nr:DUF2156 domain-containing protein [Hahellaceae bacterium]MCP5212757.1 DUF2156 domain-containing protein [Hahellaceae bacterium]